MEPTQVVTNDVHWDIVFFFVAQSLIIIGAIVAAYVRTQVAIERVRGENNQNHIEALTKIDGIEKNTEGLSRDHGNLAGQVRGISRGLARLEGHVNATRPITPIKDDGGDG